MESFPFFIKFYGKIAGDLQAGTYTMKVSKQWNTQQYKTEKSIYISTINGLGGTNLFLGIVFLIFSIIILWIMGVIVICECTRGSKPTHYSLENLKW